MRKRKETKTCILTWSVHLDALVRPLWTLAVVAVSQASVAREAIHSKDILWTGGAQPVTVLRHITLILLPAALLGPSRDLCGDGSHSHTLQVYWSVKCSETASVCRALLCVLFNFWSAPPILLRR